MGGIKFSKGVQKVRWLFFCRPSIHALRENGFEEGAKEMLMLMLQVMSLELGQTELLRPRVGRIDRIETSGLYLTIFGWLGHNCRLTISFARTPQASLRSIYTTRLTLWWRN